MRSLVMILVSFLCLTAVGQEKKSEKVFTATSLTGEARDFFNDGDYDKAIELCDKAIEAAAIYREAYILKHQAYEEMGADAGLMIENLKAAQLISLEDEELAYYLGKIYQKQAKWNAAIEEYTNAVAYSPDDSEFRYYYFYSRATCYLKKRKYTESIADYTEAISLNPEAVNAYANRGFAYYYTKDKAKSCADWRRAKELGNQQVGQYLGQCG